MSIVVFLAGVGTGACVRRAFRRLSIWSFDGTVVFLWLFYSEYLYIGMTCMLSTLRK